MDTPSSPDQQDGPVGPTVAIVIVIILLALGGVYFLMSGNARLHRTPVQQNISV